MSKTASIKNTSLFSSGVYFEQNKDFFQFLERKNPTEYDKIMDNVYRETHIGGGTHRHFDGSHTLDGSWNKIEEATGDVELTEYLKAHANELVTPEGIPIFNLDYTVHGHIGHEISEALGGALTPGTVKTYLRDLNSQNLGELASGALGAGFLGWAIMNGDSKAISRVTACNLTLGIVTGNPVQIATGLYGLGHGIYTGKIKSYELLKGALPVVAGAGAMEFGKEILDIGSEYSMLLAVAASIGTNIIINKVDKDNLKEANKELGNREDYLLVMSPTSLKHELQIFDHKRNRVDLAI